MNLNSLYLIEPQLQVVPSAFLPGFSVSFQSNKTHKAVQLKFTVLHDALGVNNQVE